MTEGRRVAGSIIFLQPDFLVSKATPFYFGVNTIGRRPENTIRIEELSVSSKHAVLKVTEKSLTITDTNSRNGVKINSDENRIAPNTEIAIDGGMIVYLGDVKCKFQRTEAHESAERTMTSRADVKRGGKYEEIKNLLLLEDEEEDKELLKMRKESFEMKAKQEMNDSFSISENFAQKEKKSGKANNKKESKKNTKVIVEEKEESKEEKKVEKPVEEKKKDNKRDSLERKNAKKNEQSEVPAAKIAKPEQKQKDKEKQRPKGGKQTKQVVFQQADKKSLDQQEVKSNISKDKLDKGKPAKQKQKPKETKQPEKSKQRKSDRQQKKSKSVPKEALKEQQKQQAKKRDRKESLQQTKQETRSEEQSEKRPSPSRSRKSARHLQGQKTKRRTENRKRLPSEKVPSDQLLPARRSFMNKRIMASGFILNLNKKYFCPVEAPEDGFDYLIMKEYKRTYKALYAISHGIPIIRYDWIKESEYFERTLKPENYYFKDLESIYAAIDKAKDGERIFRGLEFFLGSDQYHLKVEEIEMLIYSCGGEICRKVGKLSPKEKESKNLIAVVRNKEAASAKTYEEELKAIKKMGFERAYTIELILDSCEKQAVDWSSNQVRLR